MYYGISNRKSNFQVNMTCITLTYCIVSSLFFCIGVLFHRVMLLSGSANSPWAMAENPIEVTSKLGKIFNCPPVESGHILLNCLRGVSLDELMSKSRRHFSSSHSLFRRAWAPTYDGVVVHSFRYNIREYLERLSRYDMLFGIASADAFHMLNNRQSKFGMEVQERNKMLSSFVASVYKVHQREIFSAIVTEYTDWKNAHRQPVHIRDEMAMALQDAIYSAPLIETGDYHSSLNINSWFYVFDYQSKNSGYNQVYIVCKFWYYWKEKIKFVLIISGKVLFMEKI